MEWANIIWMAIFASLTFMTLFYLLSMAKKDASIVDIAWGLGFVFIDILFLAKHEAVTVPIALISIYIMYWGIRLAIHLGFSRRGKPEDWRYVQWRKDWGETFWWRSLLQIFVLRGLLTVVIISPLLVARHPDNSGTLDENVVLTALGSALWWTGFLFEAIGDWQLTKFRSVKKNKAKVMKTGLWRYTRHPNYFGEVTMWWGLWLIVLPLSGGWLAIISPITITYLLLKVSGITMLEKKYDKNKSYQDYKKKTSAFWPMPPKQRAKK